jgi:hypothetical protein
MAGNDRFIADTPFVEDKSNDENIQAAAIQFAQRLEAGHFLAANRLDLELNSIRSRTVFINLATCGNISIQEIAVIDAKLTAAKPEKQDD